MHRITSSRKGHEVKRAAGVAARWLAAALGYATSPSPPLRHAAPATPTQTQDEAASETQWNSPGACMTAPSAAGSALVARFGGGSVRSAASIGGTTRTSASSSATTSMARRASAHMRLSRDTHMRGLLQLLAASNFRSLSLSLELLRPANCAPPLLSHRSAATARARCAQSN